MKELRREYARLLAAHIEQPGESHLFEAYNFGKKCVEQGIPISEVTNTHFDILEAGEVSLTDDRVIDSQQFLLETTLAMHVSGSPSLETSLPPSVLNALYNEVVARFKELSNVKEKLRASGEKYQALYNESPNLLFRVNGNGVITICNHTAANSLGYETNELVGRHISTILNVESVASYLHKGGAALEKKEEAEDFLLKKDGTKVRVLVQSKSLFSEEGMPFFVDFTCIDITERKRAEEERRRLAAAIEQVAEGILITDRQGIIEYVNPALGRISGYSREEMIGQSHRLLTGGEHDETFLNDIWDTVSRGETWNGHITSRTKDGQVSEFKVTISPIRDRSGEIINYIAVNRDVTQEVRLEKQLRQAQKMEALGTLAGGIAHDFNNILTAIIGFTEVAMENVGEEDPARSMLDEVLRAGHRATDLVSQILAFSRQSEQTRTLVQVVPLVKEALKLLRASLPTTITIRQNIAVPADGGLLLADPTQIHQVLMNLCINAADAMREKGGTLEISLVQEKLDSGGALSPDLKPGLYLKLTVSDSGQGMELKILERIFDPFFTTKAPGKGTGMGLAVVHGIVKSHGGAITVRSEPGKGTTFQVFLPEAEGKISSESSAAAEPPTGSERILFIDDEESLVKLAQEMLENLGYRATVKINSLAALETFRDQPDRFDLVITDQTMPNLTGMELAKELISIRPDIPVILCTGYRNLVNVRKDQETGIREIILKPFTTLDLAKTIRKVLEQGGLQDSQPPA
ncbi:MAG: PAS domain S-box protein [Thermodesulfobacteriota bacterium]